MENIFGFIFLGIIAGFLLMLAIQHWGWRALYQYLNVLACAYWLPLSVA